MAQEEQLREELLFVIDENNELREKVMNAYNNFLKEYREFLSEDYAELTIYEAIESALRYAIQKDEEESGSFYTELLADWYDEQVLEWKKRLDVLKHDYMLESVAVVDNEDNVDWGEYVRPLIYSVLEWGILVTPDNNHLVENDKKGLEHIVYTVEIYNFPIYSQEDFESSEAIQKQVKTSSYKEYERLLLENNITATNTWKFALDSQFGYDRWAGRKASDPEDMLKLAQYLNQCLQRIEIDIEKVWEGLKKSEQAQLYLKETYYDDDKAEQLFKTWISTKGY